MLNKIIKISLNNRIAVIAAAALLLLAGCITLLRMEVDIFPDLNAPTVVIMTEAPGLAPEEVEQLVTYPIETAVNGAAGVRRVRSSSATGFSVVWAEFNWDTDVYHARQTVSEKLAGIGNNLPPEAGTPMLGPQSSILGEMMIVSLTSKNGETSLEQLRTIADRTISPRLMALGGISQVSVIGGDVRQYQIMLSPEKMKYHGISLQEVVDATENMNSNASGGVMYDYGNEYIIKGKANTNRIEELSNAVIRSDANGTILLSDVAVIRTGSESPKLGVASEKSIPAVLITVTKQPGAGTISLTDQIDNELSSIKNSLNSDINISTDIFRQAHFINSSITNLQQALFEGALMVIIVLFFFLMNARTTIISIVTLPLSIIITVLILNLLGMTINTMSLGGIAIAIGSLVDDAIVDVENVYKRIRENRLLPEAERRPVLNVVFNASKEVRMPIFNSSLIIMASFMPLFFLTGIEGRMLIPLGISFIIALTASTIVALTLTPVLCSYLLTNNAGSQLGKEAWASKTIRKYYEKWLSSALLHKRAVIYSTIFMFIVAAGIAFTLGRGFLPGFNEGSFTINVSALPGISLDESDRIGREAEKLIMSVPEINTVARKTGRAELDEHSLGVNVSEIEAPYTLDKRTRNEVADELRHKLSSIPGVSIEIGQPISHRIDAMLSGTESQIAIKVFGPDLGLLHNIGMQIKENINGVDGIADVNVEQQVGRPQLEIKPKRQMLARYGITMPEFIRFIDIALSGQSISQVYEDGIPYSLVLKYQNADNATLESVNDIMIDSNKGPIPLSYVAEINSTSGPNSINRENVNRRIVVSANTAGRDLRGVVNDIQKNIAENIVLPDGYYITYGGQFENEAAASRTLAIATVASLLVILFLLYSEFRNWTQSGIILLNMPLAMIGGILMLKITTGELNIPAIIGFISLLGIATRNGMLLISHYNSLKQNGIPLEERIHKGSSDRLLPIIMTALTSALALVPLALRGTEPGNEIQSPMAIVILGGLITSTILNLFVVPVTYELCYRNKKES
ncbi:efflux RND transporter permease subunit [Muribaculum caecicola]|uniref:Efflux RND transporter permease subunit n=3 Tax=Muribaculum TaxID=1918540 RepID=A0AC61S8L5_9BACT|nr:efflux RND transporter permease subunit [Muribaculum caecicola]THG54849.1 efflux RND transporter permease subunit [Muribaculum caecicola]